MGERRKEHFLSYCDPRTVPGGRAQVERHYLPKSDLSIWGGSLLLPAPQSLRRIMLIMKFPEVTCRPVGKMKEIVGFESAAAHWGGQ